VNYSPRSFIEAILDDSRTHDGCIAARAFQSLDGTARSLVYGAGHSFDETPRLAARKKYLMGMLLES